MWVKKYLHIQLWKQYLKSKYCIIQSTLRWANYALHVWVNNILPAQLFTIICIWQRVKIKLVVFHFLTPEGDSERKKNNKERKSNHLQSWFSPFCLISAWNTLNCQKYVDTCSFVPLLWSLSLLDLITGNLNAAGHIDILDNRVLTTLPQQFEWDSASVHKVRSLKKHFAASLNC